MQNAHDHNPKNEQFQGIIKTKFDSKTNANSPLPEKAIGSKIYSITS